MRKSTMLLISSIFIMLKGLAGIPTAMVILGNGNQYMEQSNAGSFKVITLVFLAMGLIEVFAALIAGIQGIRYYKVPEKADLCIKLAIINFSILVFGIILNILASSFSANTVTALFYPVLFFTLYLIGARQLRAQTS